MAKPVHDRQKCPTSQRDLHQRLKAEGGVVTLTKNNHYKAVAPNGGILFFGSTLSDYRAFANIWRQWRKVSC